MAAFQINTNLTPVVAEHHETHSFWRTYIFSEYHKIIAKQYLITGIFWAIIGTSLSTLFRFQLGFPDMNEFMVFAALLVHAPPVYRWPYDYSKPDAKEDFISQNVPYSRTPESNLRHENELILCKKEITKQNLNDQFKQPH